MKNTKPISIHLDRLAAALSAQDVDIKRTKLLEVAAATFGYHNTHECTAASQRGDLTPPPAGVVCRLQLSTGETLVVLRDPLSESPYAIDESFVEQVVEDERREMFGPSPYGHLLDLREIAADPAGAVGGAAVVPNRHGFDPAMLKTLIRAATDYVRGAGHESEDETRPDETAVMAAVDAGERHLAGSAAPIQGLAAAMRETGPGKIHVATIHHRHGIDIRLGTTLALVSRQVGEYVRENWDEAWQNDQAAERKDRIGLPEIPDGLDDDKAEEMYFAAMSLFGAIDYVDYEVIDVHGLPAAATPEAANSPEPFPGIPDDLWTVYAARDGDTVRETFRVSADEDPEWKAREIVAKAFSLDLDDYLEEPEDEDDEIDFSLFDGDTDGIEVEPAAIDPSFKTILEASWEAAQRLPAGDPLRDRIRQQVMDAMPRPEND